MFTAHALRAFPAFVLKYVGFHCSIVRPAIVEAVEFDESELIHKPMLIYSETANSPITPQRRKTFQAFLRVCESTLADSTILMLTSSYGMMMMHRSRRNELFPTYVEIVFLETLAIQMNTSFEELRSTYIGLDNSDYTETKKVLIRAFVVTSRREDSNETINFSPPVSGPKTEYFQVCTGRSTGYSERCEFCITAGAGIKPSTK